MGSLETNAKIQSTEHLKKEYMSLQKKLNSVEVCEILYLNKRGREQVVVAIFISGGYAY